MRFMLHRFFPNGNRSLPGSLTARDRKDYRFPTLAGGELSLKESVARSLKEGSDLRLKMAETMSAEIATAATAIAEAFKAGRKLLLFGNGGSAADAQHIARNS